MGIRDRKTWLKGLLQDKESQQQELNNTMSSEPLQAQSLPLAQDLPLKRTTQTTIVEKHEPNDFQVLPTVPSKIKAPTDWLSYVTVAILLFVGWNSHYWFEELTKKPEFDEVATRLEHEGRKDDAEWLREIGKVGRNGENLRLAFDMLYPGHPKLEVANASSPTAP